VTRKITRAVGSNQDWASEQAFPWEFAGFEGLGFRWGLRGGDVDDATAREVPDDYVVATEDSHTVEEFLEVAFGYVGLELERPRGDRQALLQTRRGGQSERGRRQGQEGAWLEAQGWVRAVGEDDGGRGH
jgi:hypothetical protein